MAANHRRFSQAQMDEQKSLSEEKVKLYREKLDAAEAECQVWKDLALALIAKDKKQ